MKTKLLFLFGSMILLTGITPFALAQSVAVVHGQTSDGKVGVEVYIDPPVAGQQANVGVTFYDPQFSDFRFMTAVWYSIQISQNNNIILQEERKMFEGPAPDTYRTPSLTSNTAYDISVSVLEVGTNNLWTPSGQVILFSNVVPEFGTITMIILAFSIIGVVIFTNKSKMTIR